MAQASAIKSNDRFPGEDDKLPTHPKLVLVVILIIKIFNRIESTKTLESKKYNF